MVLSKSIIILIAALVGVALGISVYFLTRHSHNPKPKPGTDPDHPVPGTGNDCIGGVGTSSYQIVKDWKGKDLKPEAGKGWEYFSHGDPTSGTVKYGKWPNLLTEHGDSIRIDLGEVEDNLRKAIRINSTDTFNEGLFIINASHMPEGLGTWPAFWLNGTGIPSGGKWACHGEIDIIEMANSDPSVKDSQYNKTSLHTNVPTGGQRCDQSGVPGIDGECGPDGAHVTAPGKGCGCSASEGCPYGGCGVFSKDPASFGWGFNKAGGGVYACELTKGGKVTVWFFSNGKIPCDISAGKPNPDKWSKDNIEVQFNPCPGQYKNLQIIINTTLCGEWAGNAYPGGWKKCNQDILAKKPEKGYWMINYVKVFKKTS